MSNFFFSGGKLVCTVRTLLPLFWGSAGGIAWFFRPIFPQVSVNLLRMTMNLTSKVYDVLCLTCMWKKGKERKKITQGKDLDRRVKYLVL